MHFVKLKTFAGMMTNGLVFCGPRSVQISVSQICNVSCMMCPTFSPLLKKQENQTNDPAFLPFETFRELALELHKLGTEKIQLVGSGEPLLNPEIQKMVKFVSSLGKECILITSGIPLTERLAEELSIPHLRFWISLHAGTPDMWCKVHPRHSIEDFYRLKQCIAIIGKSKKAKVTLHSVISNINYLETTNIVRLAVATAVKNVNISPMHLSPGLASLKLNVEQYRHLQKNLLEAKELAAKYAINNSIGEFLKLKPDYFDYGNKTEKNLAGKKAPLDTPCYIGWLYATIDSSGAVFPCCSSKLAMGNIYFSKFSKIWFSEKYRKFRRISKNAQKTGAIIEKNQL